MHPYSFIFPQNPSEEDIDMSLREIYENEDSYFPIRVHYTSHKNVQKQLIHKHWHKELEILFLTKGFMEVSIEEHYLNIEAGDILFIPSRLLHAAYNTKNQACEFYAVVFDMDFISSLQSDLIQQTYIDPLINDPQNHFYYISKMNPYNQKFSEPLTGLIEDFGFKTKGFELNLKANLLLFFTAFYRYQDCLKNYQIDNSNRNHLNTYICKQIILYVEENYMKKITLEEISQNVGFSKEHFCRFFKKNFKISFFTYLNQERIKKAEYLLLHSDMKVIEIAMKIGFDDANYFATVFKKFTHVTPSEYKRANLERLT